MCWPLYLSWLVKCVYVCLQAGVELTKAFPLWWVRLIIILMASQSDANSSNGKAKAGGGGGGELREERGELEMHKIRFAFLLEKYVSVYVRRGIFYILSVCGIP